MRTRIASRKPRHYTALAHKQQKQLFVVIRPRSREAELPYDFRSEDWQYALSYWGGCCAVCGQGWNDEITIAKDHWIPLSKPDCPGTIPSNIVPLCHGYGGCNNDKSNTYAIQWLMRQYSADRARAIMDRIEAFFKTVRKTAYDK